MMRSSQLFVTLSLVWCSCTERIPEAVIVPTIPHISWTITSESDGGREERLCQSDPRTSASFRRVQQARDGWGLFTCTADTAYSGTTRVGLFDGSGTAVHESKVDATVKVGDAPFYRVRPAG